MPGSFQTLTFLFTDIEGSTRLWASRPDAMHESLARHDQILRVAIKQNRGRVFKTMGDAFFAVFGSASDALAAALQAQIALREELETDGVRVRMAVHSGAVGERDGEFYGPPLNRLARLLSTAHGGQTLVSSATRSLVLDSLPEGVVLRDLGSHRLKDLQEPERVYELSHPALPVDFPPLRSLENLPNNLPRQLTSFIGREKEMEEVQRLLAGSPLLTLTGSGGSGKTRLALQAAANLLEKMPGGVYLVELASLTDPALIPRSIAAALSVREESHRPVLDSVVERLSAGPILILLDNCEHLLECCASLVNHLLRACPELKVLATSRQPLRVPGETVCTVPVLSMPGPRDATAEALAPFESVRLFVDRAQAVHPPFVLDDACAPAVAQICRRLDGVPLALELAASRVNVLSPAQIADRLDDRFRLLRGGPSTTDPRQRTLEATIDWSYGLLTEQERDFLRCLSVFAGGFTLRTAERACGSEEMDEFAVLDLVSGLVEKSLVVRQPSGERYHVLETIRQYGEKKLEKLGSLQTVRDRFVACMLEVAEEAAPHLQEAARDKWLAQLDAEHDNIRSALAWAIEGDSRLRLAFAMHRYWLMKGFLTEARSWLEGVIARPGADKSDYWVDAINACGIIAWQQGDLVEARKRFEESLPIVRWKEDESLLAILLSNLGSVAASAGNLTLARSCLEESQSLFRQISDSAKLADTLSNLGAIALLEGDSQSSRAYLEECIAIHKAENNEIECAEAYLNLADLFSRDGDHKSARRYVGAALVLKQKQGDLVGLSHVFNVAVLIVGASGDYSSAAILAGLAHRSHENAGIPSDPLLLEGVREATNVMRTHLGEDYQSYFEQGISLCPLADGESIICTPEES